MKNLKFITSAVLLMFSVFCFSAAAQEDEADAPASRSITSLDFKNNRKPAAAAAVVSKPSAKPNAARQKAVAALSNPRRTYKFTKRFSVKKADQPVRKVVNPKPTKPKIEELGVTYWRLRETTDADEGTPLFPVRVGEKTEDWTAERVDSSTIFEKGDRVRFTVESSRTGFLYIVNREFYTDGTTGEASVIFPTLRTRGGNNRVQAGSLIEIPSASDSVSYFTIKPRRADYAGEELIILILPNELPNFEKGLRAQIFPAPKLAKWLADWETLVDVYDAEDGTGTAYTQIEAQAANTASRSLTQEEPLPQTIYRVVIKPNAPMFVSLKLNAER